MSTQILEGYSTKEKTAYVTAIASIATADQSASEQEIEYLSNLGEAAGLGEAEQQQVIAAAKDTSGGELRSSLNILKTSELRFSLIADLIAFAESDSNVAEHERAHISTIANYLGVNDTQVEALSEYVKEAAAQPAAAQGFSGNANQEATGFGSMFGNSAIGEKLQSSGINIGSLAKGLLSMVAPMIMGSMLNKGMQGSKANAGVNSGGGLGDLLGGAGGGLGDLLGGTGGGIGGALGGMLGGNSKPGTGGGGGGLGSIIGGLSGGKGFGGIGGFLSNLLK